MALMEEVLGTALSQAQGYFGIQTLYPAIQEFAELNTNIKMVNAQLGQTFKITSPLNKNIANLAASTGLSSTKLLGAASAASRYHQVLSKDLMKSTVMFSDATGLSSESVGDFVGKMLSIGAVSEESYKKMLEGILQVRDSYGLTSEAIDDIFRITQKYALVTGETGVKIESTSSKIAEFTSRLKAAGVETSEITGLIEKMIDPDKMEDNLMLLSKMGMSIHDLTVGDPLKDLESMTPKLKSLAEDILAQPNRMIANEMAKMYGYTLEEMREFSKIDTSDRAMEERKQLEKYREEIMTATSSLKDLGNHVFGKVAEFLNSTIMPIFDNLGPKTSGILAAGFAIAVSKIVKAFFNIKKGITETGRKVGGIYRASLISGAEDASEILRMGISKALSSEKNTRNLKAGLGLEEFESKSSSQNIPKSKKKNKNYIEKTNKMVDEYNRTLYDALTESEARLQNQSDKIKEFKSMPNDARKYYQDNINLMKELNKEDLNWFERKSLEQRERKFNKPLKVKKDTSLEKQYGLVKERTAEIYEKYLERETNIQKLQANVDNLRKSREAGTLTDYQEKELNRAESRLTSLTGQNDNLFKEITKTKSGMQMISSFYDSDMKDLSSMKEKVEVLQDQKNKALIRYDELVEKGDIAEANRVKDTINNLEKGIEQIDSLSKEIDNRIRRVEGNSDVLDGIRKGVSEDAARQRSGEDLKTINKALKAQAKTDRKDARRTALGLDKDASFGRVGVAYAGTAAKAGMGYVGTAAKGMLGGLTSMLNPAMLGMMGGTMLMGTLMKNEEFQKTVTSFLSNMTKLLSPVMDFLAKALGAPLKFINNKMEKLLALPIFKDKDKEEQENKDRIVNDLRRYEEASRVVYSGKNIEVYLEKMVQAQEQGNNIANTTSQATEIMAYASRNT
jgi:hypothetical protein